jgi:BirA family biotin operon repressor/biotin-[acetyl-CoA-carboxylase] ligase
MADFPRSAGGIPVEVFETIGSTNAEAIERARAGERGPLWIVARSQDAGRGRRGRKWISERGNLYASLFLTDAAPPAMVSGICFVAGLALHDAVLEAAPSVAAASLKLKWPNDLMLDRRKMAGILVEGLSASDGTAATIVGFGVNCRSHPDGNDYEVTDLAAAGHAVAPEALLAALGDAMGLRLQQWNRGENFATVRNAWLARASGLGEPIEVRLPDRTLAGTFDTIDPTGALVLRRREGGRETISAGDVFSLAAR